MLQLDLRTLLPLTRAAFEAGQLQAQQPDVRPDTDCLYAGPCAIGVGIPEDQRAALDSDEENTSIRELVSARLIGVPPEQLTDFATLQTAHDAWVGTSRPDQYRTEFLIVLKNLEARYVY